MFPPDPGKTRKSPEDGSREKLREGAEKIALAKYIFLWYTLSIMKAITVVIIILIGLAVYSFFDQFLGENLPEQLELPGEKKENPLSSIGSGSASVYNPNGQPATPSPKKPSENNENNQQEENNQEEENKKILGEIKIYSVSDKNYYHPAIITLKYRLKYKEKVNISGWKIKARMGEIKIPQAVEKYQSSRDPKDIILEGSGTIYLISDQNPLGRNKNFRLNKCMGYLKNYNEFYPSFYVSCPRPDQKEISLLNPWCQEFVFDLSRCEIPNYSNEPKIAGDPKCVSFLKNNFSYSSCFNNYNQNEDFLKDYWYLYIKTEIAHELHDTVSLYDKKGELIDEYIY